MTVNERIEVVDGVEMYRITNFDAMDPFLMTVVSNCDLWMFLSSTGGLTAGRVEPADALFPYETDDRLHGAGGRVGPITVLRVSSPSGDVLWEPFTGGAGATRRSLFKSLLGDAVLFEEVHADLELTFRYRWAPSEAFGWVRTASLSNHAGGADRTVEIVDGVLNVMPWGVGVPLQQQMSNLANAYRRSEIIEPGIGVYTLEALIVDRPEPAEALRATTVWTTGLEQTRLSLDGAAPARARRGGDFEPARLLTGRPGCYLVNSRVELAPGTQIRWHIVGDVAQTHGEVARLRARLRSGEDLAGRLEADIARSSSDLRAIVASADGLQRTGSSKMDAHHVANTLFNVMRGGTFLEGYTVRGDRFGEFVGARNRPVAARHAGWLGDLPAETTVQELRYRAAAAGDPSLARLAHEYLPLGFSRRHGDPSRPWNQFAIRVRDEHDEPLLTYQGNWRDIFQNWEALSRSFPAYLPSMVAKFLNASTVEGFNPYRLTSEGIDWEVLEPDNPWSGIGYWGDHQIVYLYRLLAALEAHSPGWLADELPTVGYAFANVPYRLVPFARLIEDPKDTVTFDDAAADRIEALVDTVGADGKLVVDGRGEVLHVSLLEKLLIPLLSKLSNYVPGGGIWMNTQRPEWNDANNALVGYGLSMVTLAQLRPYVELIDRLVAGGADEYPVSERTIAWMTALVGVLDDSEPVATPESRLRLLTRLGEAFETYRTAAYQNAGVGPQPLGGQDVRRLCRVALRHIDQSIRDARRSDGLYDAYNLLRLSADGAEVEPLYPMLEGQVAAISSGLLGSDEIVELGRAMYASALYRPDVDSFMLYPARPRASFMERNRVPADEVSANPLLVALLEPGRNPIIERDVDGVHHFHADFTNARDLEAALDRLAGTDMAPLVERHREATLALFEKVFNHHAFTGRSATMYGYEGVGSVYWHMVAKLLVAIQERILEHAPGDDVAELVALYERVREGLGFNRTAAEYGAFPTDPYSHTPAHAGAQQPGMTGQVKEELLTRWAELGLTVADGRIRFTPVLLAEREFTTATATLEYRDVDGRPQSVPVEPGSAAFTVCQVPVVVHASTDADHIVVSRRDGDVREVPGRSLDRTVSQEIFDRTGTVTRLDVFIGR